MVFLPIKFLFRTSNIQISHFLLHVSKAEDFIMKITVQVKEPFSFFSLQILNNLNESLEVTFNSQSHILLSFQSTK